MSKLIDALLMVAVAAGCVALTAFALFLCGAFWGLIAAGIYNVFKWLT